jgi:hypothetical protein
MPLSIKELLSFRGKAPHTGSIAKTNGNGKPLSFKYGITFSLEEEGKPAMRLEFVYSV